MKKGRSMKIVHTLINLVAATLLIVGPKTIFKACEVGDKPMKCYWSIRSVAVVAILLVVIAISNLFVNTVKEKLILNIFTVATASVILLIPRVVVGGCGMSTMPCQSKTFPAFYLISGIVIAISLVEIVILLRSLKRGEKTQDE